MMNEPVGTYNPLGAVLLTYYLYTQYAYGMSLVSHAEEWIMLSCAASIKVWVGGSFG